MGINNVNVLNPAERILTSTASTDTFNRFELGADGSVWRGIGTAAVGRKPELIMPLVSVPLTLTAQLLADGFVLGDNSYEYLADLTSFSQVRLTSRVKTVSASASSPKVQLRFSAATTTVVASKLILGATSVEVSLFTGVVHSDSGWINLVAAARIESCFLGLMSIGGDGVISPVVANVMAHFR